jgi:hypothetical protein
MSCDVALRGGFLSWMALPQRDQFDAGREIISVMFEVEGVDATAPPAFEASVNAFQRTL